MIKFCQKVIEYSFYILFFLTPLTFTSQTAELFEFNKMWIVFGITLVIATCWINKMVFEGRIRIQRTKLDLPILLFLVSHILSTIISLDSHVSLWGYYSRFNGGLLSIFSYILLYYAFVTNFKDKIKIVKRLLKLSLVSGLIVALWGLPSHFGYDPTCFVFRGNLDVSCWTDAFQPKVRIFSTFGQPNWLAAYLAILIPIAISYALKSQIDLKNKLGLKFNLSKILNLNFGIYSLLILLFFIDLIYTGSRSGFIGLAFGLFIFLIGLLFLLCLRKTEIKRILITFLVFLILPFFTGTPFTPKINDLFKTEKANKSTIQDVKQIGPALEVGGTESGQIRKIVWQGAIDVFKSSPLLGSGVETFAFAYYKYRPISHNLTSEWDYLYNKAHNEYLNYLATTGILGLGSYLSIILIFLFITIKFLKSKIYYLENNADFEVYILTLAFIASFISITVSNFFGFSVVMINLYLFFIPAFFFVINDLLEPNKSLTNSPSVKQLPSKKLESNDPSYKWIFSIVLFTTSFYLIFNLFKFWSADTSYAQGYNLDRVGMYTQAFPKLQEAIDQRGDEPVFKDELSINLAILAIDYANKKDATSAAKFAKEAIEVSNNVVSEHPNNIVFWKTRARLFYTLGQADPRYLTYALDALIKANTLAPTDAKIAYNLGVLYGQTGNVDKGAEILEKTIQLKPDYKDAYYALGLFYREQAIDKSGKVVKSEKQKKAAEIMKLILNRFDSNDTKVKDSLKNWGEL